MKIKFLSRPLPFVRRMPSRNMRCFVIMPYGTSLRDADKKRELDILYEELIKPAVESVYLPDKSGEFVKCHRADKEPRPGEIVMHIIENLVLSEIAIADLTGRNPNVFYELGVRHAVNDNTILLAQGEDDIPVDLRGQRYFIYRRDFEGGVRLRTALISAVREIVRSPSKVDNPVRRFLYDAEREKIEAQGRPPGYDFVRELLQQVTGLRREIKMQVDEVRQVLNAVTSSQPVMPGKEGAELELSFLEGAWKASPVGSHLYGRMVHGQLLVPYSYGGDDALTGRFYNFRRIEQNIFARFEWLTGAPISGYALFRIGSSDELVGGWWHSSDLPPEAAQDATRITERTPGMNAIKLKRLTGKHTPGWAEEYFAKAARL